MTFNIDSGNRTSRTQILTCSATDTQLCVDSRNLPRFRIIGIHWNHLDGTNRAMPCAVATLMFVGIDNTVLLDPNGMTNLDRRLIFNADRLDGTSWTSLRALHAFRTAIATLVAHHRLHQRQQIRTWAQYLVRTSRYAELATRTVALHVTCTQRSRRGDRCRAR